MLRNFWQGIMRHFWDWRDGTIDVLSKIVLFAKYLGLVI